MYAAVEESLEEVDHDLEAVELSHSELVALAGIDGYEVFEEKCSELEVDDQKMWFYVSHYRAKGKLELLEEDLLELKTGSRETLEFLRKKGVSLAVVSNAPDPTVDEVIRFFELDSLLEFFLGIKDLDDLMDRKPRPRHIEIALDELKADKVLYVGDSSVDVEAAEKIGADSAILGENEEATFEIRNLQDLKDIVE